MPDSYQEYSQALAVLDGRFLPVCDYTVEVQQQMETVHGVGDLAPQSTVKTGQLIQGTLSTRREPLCRRTHQQLRIYTDDRVRALYDLNFNTNHPKQTHRDMYLLSFAAKEVEEWWR